MHTFKTTLTKKEHEELRIMREALGMTNRLIIREALKLFFQEHKTELIDSDLNTKNYKR